jgi:hypothetical protein
MCQGLYASNHSMEEEQKEYLKTLYYYSDLIEVYARIFFLAAAVNQ